MEDFNPQMGETVQFKYGQSDCVGIVTVRAGDLLTITSDQVSIGAVCRKISEVSRVEVKQDT
jgi:hypothetical protein